MPPSYFPFFLKVETSAFPPLVDLKRRVKLMRQKRLISFLLLICITIYQFKATPIYYLRVSVVQKFVMAQLDF